MDCPFCKTTGLSEDTSTCPQCESDLRAIGLIEKTQNAFSSQKRQKTLWILLTLFLAIALILSMLLPTVTGNYVSESEYTELNNQLIKSQNDLKQANLEAENLQKQVVAVNAEQQAVKCDEFTYTVQWGENLSAIASAVYGDGNQYAKIAADNSLENPNHILDGQKLIIRY